MQVIKQIPGNSYGVSNFMQQNLIEQRRKDVIRYVNRSRNWICCSNPQCASPIYQAEVARFYPDDLPSFAVYDKRLHLQGANHRKDFVAQTLTLIGSRVLKSLA